MSGAQDHTGRFFCLERFPCHEMHISTTGHRASPPESRILASEPKDRYRAIWKTRERLKSTRRRPCDCQSPPARYYSGRPDRNQPWALLSRFQAVRRAHFDNRSRLLKLLPASQGHYGRWTASLLVGKSAFGGTMPEQIPEPRTQMQLWRREVDLERPDSNLIYVSAAGIWIC